MKRDHIEVTTANFGDLLVESMRAAVAYERGEIESRVSRRKITARKAAASPPPLFDAARIRKIRDGFGVSQPVFAGMVGVATATVKGWEQGVKNPSGSSRRVLQMMELSPRTAVTAARIDGIEVTERVTGAPTNARARLGTNGSVRAK